MAGETVVWALLIVMPLFMAPSAKDAFRTPKLLLAGWLGLASVAWLAWDLRRVGRVAPADIWRLVAVRAVVPMLAVATIGLWVTDHPLYVRDALADLWIGAACLVGWSVGLTAGQQRRLIAGLIGPATALAVLAVDQVHHIVGILDWLIVEETGRLALTATAGNTGNLAAALVLPCLIAQWLLARGTAGPRRVAAVVALGLCLYALVLTQTIAALAALALGSAVFWFLTLPRRLTGMAVGATVLVLVVSGAALPVLRGRLVEKTLQLAQGDLNAVLTGRLDAWRAAVWMLERHPAAGVGHGAFPASFVTAKLDLLDRGVEFYPIQPRVMFANAHNEVLEVGAEWGVPGLLALAWALWVLLRTVRRRRSDAERGLAWGCITVLAVLSMAHFPFRTALIGFPAILVLAWLLGPEER